jgi:hypothetical protein
MTDVQCLGYQSGKGQIQPPAVRVDRTASPSALGTSQLQSLERQAAAAGTYWPNGTGTCPTTTAQLSSVGGAPVVVKGPCNITISGGTINSSASPGVLVIENGSLTLTGNTTFYGLIYMVNQQGSWVSVLSIQGNAAVQGALAVDGLAGVTLGSSKTNLIYDPRAANLLSGDSGAAINKNTFRVLPKGTA